MRGVKTFFKDRWEGRGGWKELLAVSFPLILSTSAASLQHFIDRLFLSWFSPEAIAAAMPAGMLQFTLLSIFIGTAGYSSTFVAQYYGATRSESIGPAVWQGVYISLFGALLVAFTLPFAPIFFAGLGHPEMVVVYEVEYYTTLCWGAFPAIAGAALAGYFSGQGRTWPILAANLIATAVNLFLDYGLIFGRFGMPKWGVMGAAFATNMSFISMCLFYLFLMTRERYSSRAPFFRDPGIKRDLMARYFKYGFPAGIQFFVEIAGYSAFLLLIGRLGTEALAATTIAFNINNLAFMPLLGLGAGVSVLVGQAQGEKNPDRAARSTWSGLWVAYSYMLLLCAFYVIAPGVFIEPFAANNPQGFELIREYATVLLRFVAAYCIFDTLNIIFSGTLRGAGDTRFIFKVILAMSTFVLVIPTAIAIFWFGAGIYTTWVILTIQVSMLGLVFFFRFLNGKWRGMRVIEDIPKSELPGVNNPS